MSNMNQVMVTKATGEKEPYDEAKIRASASRVGVPQNLQNQMISEIRRRLYDGIATKDIFTIIHNFLSQTENPYLASRYNLKKALAQLGPSGYPFEQYVARLLSESGYQTRTNVTMNGRCIGHEVDVLATIEGKAYPIEVKFRSSENQRTDIKVLLYIRARFEDLQESWQGAEELSAWIFTNTRFSTDALKYGACRDIMLTSWNQPKGKSLRELIEKTHLHPITMLDTLSSSEKKFLISSNILVCPDLLISQNQALLPASKKSEVVKEANFIVSTKPNS
jgi:Holliday junction resolvase-like predicted endonuclease